MDSKIIFLQLIGLVVLLQSADGKQEQKQVTERAEVSRGQYCEYLNYKKVPIKKRPTICEGGQAPWRPHRLTETEYCNYLDYELTIPSYCYKETKGVPRVTRAVYCRYLSLKGVPDNKKPWICDNGDAHLKPGKWTEVEVNEYCDLLDALKRSYCETEDFIEDMIMADEKDQTMEDPLGFGASFKQQITECCSNPAASHYYCKTIRENSYC